MGTVGAPHPWHAAQDPLPLHPLGYVRGWDGSATLQVLLLDVQLMQVVYNDLCMN